MFQYDENDINIDCITSQWTLGLTPITIRRLLSQHMFRANHQENHRSELLTLWEEIVGLSRIVNDTGLTHDI